MCTQFTKERFKAEIETNNKRKKTTNGVVITNIGNFVGTRKTQKYTRNETYLPLNLIAFHYRPLQ